MLTKTFEGQANNTQAGDLEKGAAPMSYFTEVFNALSYFHIDDFHHPLLQKVIGRVIGDIPDNVIDLNKGWNMQRSDLLRDRSEAYLNFSEVLATIKIHALTTYLHPSQTQVAHTDARSDLDRAFSHAHATARQASEEFLGINQTPEVGQSIQARLKQNEALALRPYDGNHRYEELMEHFKATQAHALQATLRLAELDLAYTTVNISCFKNFANVKLECYMDEMRKTQSAHHAVTVKERLVNHRARMEAMAFKADPKNRVILQ